MTALKWKPFGGMVPRAPETDLPAMAALLAENVNFSSGELRSLKGSYKLRDMGLSALSVWSEDGLRFYAWPEDVDAVISPLQSGQANDRLYYTTDTDFRVTARSLATVGGAAPNMHFRVGVPKPSTAIAVTVVHPVAPTAPPVSVDASPADTYAARLAAAQAAAAAKMVADTTTGTDTVAYTYTYANIYNEEGPPAPPATVDVKWIKVNGVVTYSKVTVQVKFDGSGQYVPINAARVYRTSRGNSADYYYAMTVNGSTGLVSKDDTVRPEALNELLTSLDAYPPDPLLKGLMHLGNGILAAWKGSELWFSDPYRPWSWPPAYMKSFGNTIIGAHPHGTGALVTTVGPPALVSGVAPDGMAVIPLEIPQAGVSKWAMLSLKGMAVYACNDGIVAVVGGQPDLALSQRFFTREVWQARYGNALGTMEFAHYDGKLVVFSKSNAFTAFMLDLDEANGSMTELPGFVARAALVLVTTDQMYTLNGTGLYQFAGGADLTARWKSGDLVAPAPIMLAVGQAECTGTWTIKFYQRGVLGYTVTLQPGETTFRLPSQAIPGHAGLPPSDRWQIEITGSGRLKWLKAASSIRELNGV